jgi:hypothetical protein
MDLVLRTRGVSKKHINIELDPSGAGGSSSQRRKTFMQQKRLDNHIKGTSQVLTQVLTMLLMSLLQKLD